MSEKPTRLSAPAPQDSVRLSPGDLIAFIKREQESQLTLCTTLELIADELPNPPRQLLTICSVDILRECLTRQTVLEETYLFPALRRRVQKDEPTRAMLVQLSKERESDDCLAQEIAECLEFALQRARIKNPEMLGYMLRHFFECRRRHIAWCRSIMLPLARHRLSAFDLEPFTLNDVERSLLTSTSDLFHSQWKCTCGKRCNC